MGLIGLEEVRVWQVALVLWQRRLDLVCNELFEQWGWGFIVRLHYTEIVLLHYIAGWVFCGKWSLHTHLVEPGRVAVERSRIL